MSFISGTSLEDLSSKVNIEEKKSNKFEKQKFFTFLETKKQFYKQK